MFPLLCTAYSKEGFRLFSILGFFFYQTTRDETIKTEPWHSLTTNVKLKEIKNKSKLAELWQDHLTGYSIIGSILN